jgi:predicted dehydrogenase
MKLTRRQILPAAAPFLIVPRHVLGGDKRPAPSDKLVIAGVGVGGMGAQYLKGCESENIAVLCDVDDVHAAKTYAKYPAAKTYRDYRVMLEKEKGIDAVVIGTPDHTHAVIAMSAMQHGKHVYCAKPMTRTIEEARLLKKTAIEKKLATQMSVQSHASDASRTTVEWVRAGAVGKVHEVHVWNDRPVWPQGCQRPADAPPVPASLDWNLWLGPASERPYHPIYHPFNFRGWVDFGTGALGDMGCHTLHVIMEALQLGLPVGVDASIARVLEPALKGDADTSWTRSRTAKHPETFPHSSIVTWRFAARGKQPAVRVSWYDGGLKPPVPEGWDPAKPFPIDGILFVGEKGVLFSGFTGGPRLLPESKNQAYNPPKKTLPRTTGHYMDWVNSCKGGPDASCNFGFAAEVTEVALLGALAQRVGGYLEWDAANMKITNDANADALVRGSYRQGWKLI